MRSNSNKYLKPPVILVILSVLCILIYGQTVNYDFTLDDAIVITENVYTQQGLQGVDDIFSYDSFYGFFQDSGKSFLVEGGRYRPLSIAMYALEHQLAGNEPFFHHLMNILWYILNCILVFYAVRILIPGKYSDQENLIAAIVALWFTVHPLHVEAVANIKGRDEILALTGSLAALIYFFRQINSYSILSAVLLFIFSFLSALSKENAVFFIAIIPVLGILLNNISIGKTLKCSYPILLGVGLYMALRFWVLGTGVGSEQMEFMNNPFLKYDSGRLVAMSFSEKWGAIIYGLGKYMKLFLIPWPLTHDYYPRSFPITGLLSWQVLLTVSFYLALVIGAINYIKKLPLFTAGIVIFFATLFPVSNIVFNIGTHLSERFMYMPLLGLCISLVALLAYKKLLIKKYVLIILGIYLMILGGISMLRTTVWESNKTLFLTDVETSSQSAKANNAAGGILTTEAMNHDDELMRKSNAGRAVNYLEKAIEIHPNYKNAHLLLGNAHLINEKYRESIASYRRALQLDPGYNEARGNLVIALRSAGRYYGEQKGDLGQSREFLLEAEKLDPDNAEVKRLLGVNYGINNQPVKAIEYFKDVIKLQKKSARLLLNIGVSYRKLNQQDSAQYYFNEARKLDPDILNNRSKN